MQSTFPFSLSFSFFSLPGRLPCRAHAGVTVVIMPSWNNSTIAASRDNQLRWNICAVYDKRKKQASARVLAVALPCRHVTLQRPIFVGSRQRSCQSGRAARFFVSLSSPGTELKRIDFLALPGSKIVAQRIELAIIIETKEKSCVIMPCLARHSICQPFIWPLCTLRAP